MAVLRFHIAFVEKVCLKVHNNEICRRRNIEKEDWQYVGGRDAETIFVPYGFVFGARWVVYVFLGHYVYCGVSYNCCFVVN